MNQFTTSVSRPAKRPGGTDDRELNLIEFGQMVLEAWTQTQDFKNLTHKKHVQGAKADSFPVIGRKRDAADHTPGDLILGGSIESEEVQIFIDNMLVDSVFKADIDDILLHYDNRAAYSKQLGESVGSVHSKRIAQTIVLASRLPALLSTHVTPIRIASATMKTSAAKMEEAHFRATTFLKENDIGGGEISSWWPWAQYMLLARYAAIDKTFTTGTGDRGNANVGMVGGILPKGTNFIPNTLVTTGLAKYQGDFTNTVGFAANNLACGELSAKEFTLDVVDARDRLGTLMIASELCGFGALRRECSIEYTQSNAGANVIDIG